MPTTAIPAGADLQLALDQAAPGDTLTLETGATWVGAFTLAPRTSGAPVTVRSASDSGGLATLRSPSNTLPALRTLGSTAGWRFRDLAFAVDASQAAIVSLGDGIIADAAFLPNDLTFDHCQFTADHSAKNGVELNARGVTLRHCQIRGVKLQGVESHAIVGYNGPGPFVLEDNIFEAGSIGILFGGAKAAIPNLVPADITILRNLVTRPIALQTQTGWGIKNLLELKNAQRVTVRGNTFEYNWVDGQSGYAIVFTVRANSASAPWSTVRDVLFESNVVRGVASAFNILGLDDERNSAGAVNPSQPMDGVVIRNNLLYDIDRRAWAAPNGTLGGGVIVQINGGPRNLRIENNTAVGAITGNIINLGGPAIPGFVFRQNIVQKQTKPTFPYDTYGIIGNNVGEGDASLAAYCPHVEGFPDRLLAGNVFAGCTPAQYASISGVNSFPTVAALQASFADVSAGNYRSTMIGGVDMDALEAAQIAIPEPPPAPEPVILTRADIIDVAQMLTLACDGIGGNVSPQQAAKDKIADYCDTLLAALGNDAP